MTNGDVIELKSYINDNDKLPLTVGNRRKYCSHRYVVDGEKRTVECSRCGAVVDPFDAIYDTALDWDTKKSALIRLDIDIKRANEELEDLKRQKRNLKSTIRRLKKQVTEL